MKKDKPAKKIPKNSSESYVKKAYRLYKENRKKVYKHIYKNSGGIYLATEDMHDTLGINKSYLKIANGDWQLAAEYKVLEGAFLTLEWDQKKAGLLYILPDLYRKIMPRYHKYYYHKAVEKYGRIVYAKTDVMLEYLLRGWKHIDQVRWDESKPYTIQAQTINLVWPESYRHHQDAIEMADKVGIQGFATCPLPKDYNYSTRSFESTGAHTLGFNI